MDINLPGTSRDSRGRGTVSESFTWSKSDPGRLQVLTVCMIGKKKNTNYYVYSMYVAPSVCCSVAMDYIAIVDYGQHCWVSKHLQCNLIPRLVPKNGNQGTSFYTCQLHNNMYPWYCMCMEIVSCPETPVFCRSNNDTEIAITNSSVTITQHAHTYWCIW